MTITRDDWGIAHVNGKSDADAVFGMIYAQAEDDFPRIEANYLTALGRGFASERRQSFRISLCGLEEKADVLAVDPSELAKAVFDQPGRGMGSALCNEVVQRDGVRNHHDPVDPGRCVLTEGGAGKRRNGRCDQGDERLAPIHEAAERDGSRCARLPG